MLQLQKVHKSAAAAKCLPRQLVQTEQECVGACMGCKYQDT
jgi:hypothetical protein